MSHKVRGEFITNIDWDANGHNFLKSAPNITFVGRKRLNETYISDARDIPVNTKAEFNIVGFNVTEYTVDANTRAVIAPVKAVELVKLSGIADQSIFAYNVRGPLGKTGVNKDIVKSIENKKLHRLFPVFHNGITVIAKKVETSKEKLTVNDYFVVNGCQSLSAFFDHKNELTDDLRVLTKFVQMEPTGTLAKLVTEVSNNQNGVKARDFMSNNTLQIRLQNEFRSQYKNEYFFEIKQGEIKDDGIEISNEEAGLLLMAFDLGEPWATHRKYRVFDDKYADIFGRKEVTADHIVLCHVISEVVDDALPELSNSLIAKYILTRYMLIFCVKKILEKDELWPQVRSNPDVFVRTGKARKQFRECIKNIVGDLIVDVNAELEEVGEDFDYRDKLRDAAWVSSLTRAVVADHIKMVTRKKIKSFKDDWGK